jgi:hypothetical protein
MGALSAFGIAKLHKSPQGLVFDYRNDIKVGYKKNDFMFNMLAYWIYKNVI